MNITNFIKWSYQQGRGVKNGQNSVKAVCERPMCEKKHRQRKKITDNIKAFTEVSRGKYWMLQIFKDFCIGTFWNFVTQHDAKHYIRASFRSFAGRVPKYISRGGGHISGRVPGTRCSKSTGAYATIAPVLTVMTIIIAWDAWSAHLFPVFWEKYTKCCFKFTSLFWF